MTNDPGGIALNVRHLVRRSSLITGLMLAAGIAILALGAAIRVADLRLAPVLSNSMRPTFQSGDLVVTQAVPTSAIHVGDVITFLPPGSTQALIHRVASMTGDVITTKGDANPVADPWQVTLDGPTSFRLVAVVPFVGWLTDLQRPALLLAGLFLGLAIVLQLWKGVKTRLTKVQPQSQA